MKNLYNLSFFLFFGTVTSFAQTASNQTDYTGNKIAASIQQKTMPSPEDNAVTFADPLVIIDGKNYGKMSLSKLDNLMLNGKKFNVDDVEAIDILKSQTAKSVYGDKGRNGVILITTKNSAAGKSN